MEAKSLISSPSYRNRWKAVFLKGHELFEVIRLTLSPAFWANLKESISLLRSLIKYGSIQIRTSHRGEIVAESLLFLSGDINLSISRKAMEKGFERPIQQHQAKQTKMIKRAWLLPYVLLAALGELMGIYLLKGQLIEVSLEVWELVGQLF